jgi:glycosyltransferase involved in cell wall biosynthesis
MASKEFKIHSICVVKNEVDIIGYCLEQALQWSDYIYIYDNGSTDGTWEKVQSLRSDRIIPWKQDDKCFQESLRGEVFNEFKHKAKPDDWWCRLDADEFYVQSPRDFLSKVHPLNHVVWGISIEYYLDQSDVETLNFAQPLSKLLSDIHHYKAENSEPRFFRHRERLIWGENDAWPQHMGLVNEERILYKHYKYRTPKQIQRRLDTRKDSRRQGFPGWEHAMEDDWRKKIVDSESLHYDLQDGKYIVDTDKLPNHLEALPKRLFKQVMHSTGMWA